MMRTSVYRTLAVVVLAVLSASCEEPLTVCNLNLVYGLIVVPTDSITGRSLAGSGTLVEVRDGSYVDTLQQMSATEYQGAGERPGTYTVMVQHQGYRPWQRNDIRVREDECHVIPVRVDARLEPL